MPRLISPGTRALFLVAAILSFCHSAAWAGSDKDAEPLKLELQCSPEASVEGIAISPDGSMVASASGSDGIRLYDAKSGTFLRAVDGGERGVSFSPNGKLVGAAGFHMDKLVRLFDVQTGRVMHALAGHTVVECYDTAFSPDGKLFASAGREDQQILVWELPSGKLRHRLTADSLNPTSIAFLPDSKTLVSGGGDRLVRLWDMESGQARQTLKGHRDWICTVAVSADGRTIASGCCDFAYHRGRDPVRFEWGDPTVESEWKLWDAASGELKRTVSVPGRMLALALSPDGNWLACGVGKEVWLFDLHSDAPGRVVSRHAMLVTNVAFLPDSSALLSSSHDLTVQRVGLADGKLQWRLPGHHEQVNAVAFSADGALLVTGSSDERFARRLIKPGDPATGPGAVRVWDARSGRLERRLGDPAEQVMAVAVSPDSKQIVGAGTDQKGAGVVHSWDAASGKAAWSTADHASEVVTVAYSPEGTLLASGSADGVVQLRDAKTGAVIHTLSGHEGGATSLAFAKDGALVVCGEGFGGIRVWDTQSGKLVESSRPLGGARAATITMDRLFNTIAMLPDGRRYYSRNASVGNTYGEPLRLWEIGADQPHQLKTPLMGSRPIALSPDGSILAGGGKSVQLWDTQTGKELRRLTGILKRVQAIGFSADGRLVASGGSYGTTNIWDVASGRRLLTLFTFDDSQTGKTNDEWLAYAPDGSYECSPGAEQHLAWRVDDELRTVETIGQKLHRPERIETLLSGEHQGKP